MILADLHNWKNYYTTAGRDGRDKFQVCTSPSPPARVNQHCHDVMSHEKNNQVHKKNDYKSQIHYKQNAKSGIMYLINSCRPAMLLQICVYLLPFVSFAYKVPILLAKGIKKHGPPFSYTYHKLM